MKKDMGQVIAKHRLSIQITRIISMVMLVLVVFQIVYFFSFLRYRKETLAEGSEVIANSIAVSIGSMFDDIKASSIAFAFSEDVGAFVEADTGYDQYESYLKVSELTRFVCIYNEEVANVILITKDLETYALKTNIESMLSDNIYGQFSKQVLLDGKQELFFASHKTNSANSYKLNSSSLPNSNYSSTDKLELVVYRTPVYAQTEESGNSYVEVGAMLFEMNTDGLYKIVENSQEYSDIVITISDKYNNTIRIGDAVSEETEYIDVMSSIDGYDVDIKVSKPMNYFNDDSRFFTIWLVVNIIVFLIMIILVSLIIYLRITRPIDRMNNQIKQMHVGTKKKYIEVEENEVVSVIADEINILMDKNREQTRSIMNTQRRLFEAELSEKEAQFHALQLQINPHFLYNTLSCIKAKALIHDQRDIASMTTSMAKIFRYSIHKEKYVTVEREVKFIEEYLKIMRVRHEDKYTFELDMDESLNNYQSLKMILQPMIENAIKHGLDNRLEAGFIKIEVKKEDENLIYRVIDNGAGFTKERLEEVLNALNNPNQRVIGDSIGLINVHKRLRDNYGDAYGVRISTSEDMTTIVLVQPIGEFSTKD